MFTVSFSFPSLSFLFFLQKFIVTGLSLSLDFFLKNLVFSSRVNELAMLQNVRE